MDQYESLEFQTNPKVLPILNQLGESGKKGAKQCVYNPLKLYILKINSYTFKVPTIKFSWKLTMFQKYFYMFKALKKSMWTNGFFVWIFFFLYQTFTKLFQFFCEL